MDATQLWIFVAATLVLNITPGPDMLFTMANGIQRGAKAGVAAAVGIGCGAFFHAAMAAIGISALIAASDVAFDVLRYAGAAYLIWIGVKNLLSKPQPQEEVTVPEISYSQLFTRGLMTNILNPKVILFFVALLPQFVDQNAANLPWLLFFMGCFVGLTGTVVNGTVGVFAGGAGRMLLQHPSADKWIARVTGTLFVGLGIRLFLMEKN